MEKTAESQPNISIDTTSKAAMLKKMESMDSKMVHLLSSMGLTACGEKHKVEEPVSSAEALATSEDDYEGPWLTQGKAKNKLTLFGQIIKEAVEENSKQVWANIITDPTGDPENGPKIVESIASTAVKKQAQLNINKEERGNNVIIYKAPQSSNASAAERKTHDLEFITKLTDKLDLESPTIEKCTGLVRKTMVKTDHF